ncbi:hypothetical protein V1525DRAFT_407909 [Lipomyces kononenkoae]|uniref:Uncharacterized protein n=1 Tax=Lipomyces kononenkoae TaxID=34357 RepID=A0ACC3SWZ1_LIPKO
MRIADTDVPKLVLVPKQTELEVFYHSPLHRELASVLQYRIMFRDQATVPSENTESGLTRKLSENGSKQPTFTADNIVHQVYDSLGQTLIGAYTLQEELFVLGRSQSHNRAEAATSEESSRSSMKAVAARFFNPRPVPCDIGEVVLYNPTTTHPVSTLLNNTAELYGSLCHHAYPAGLAFTFAPPPSVTTKEYRFVWTGIDISSSFGGPTTMSGKCNFVDPTSKSTRITIAKLYIYDLDKLLYPTTTSKSASDELNNEIVLMEDNIRLLDVDVDRKGFETCLLLSVFLIATMNERARGLESREKQRKKAMEATERAERARVLAQDQAEAQKERERERANAKVREELRKNEEFARKLQEKEQAKVDKERLKLEKEDEKYARMLATRENEARKQDEELARKLQIKEEQALAKLRRSDEELAQKLQMEEDSGTKPTRRYAMKFPKLTAKFAQTQR